MEKQEQILTPYEKKIFFMILVGGVVLLGGFFILRAIAYHALDQAALSVPTPTPIQQVITPTLNNSSVRGAETSNNSISYQGESGKDALTLLKQLATVEQDNSGMIVGINGRKADSSKHEYWAFYVNGKLSSVGAADYVTKNSDVIKWQIETY